MQESNRRQFYRVSYPEGVRPRLVVGCAILEVIDCSERGLRFVAPTSGPEWCDHQVEGRLRLHSGGEVRVRGRVVRTTAMDTSLRLDGRGIPFRTILREQIHLRARQPSA